MGGGVKSVRRHGVHSRKWCVPGLEEGGVAILGGRHLCEEFDKPTEGGQGDQV